MGLYDRDYGRSDQTPWDRAQNPRSIITILIVINVVVFFVQMIFTYVEKPTLPGGIDQLGLSDEQMKSLTKGVRHSHLDDYLACSSASLFRPWMWFQLLTYGFLHSIHNILHIAFNMFLLFVFGKPVEQKLGGQEFLKVYLTAIVVGGIVAMIYPWLVSLVLTGGFDSPFVNRYTMGASGAVVAIMVLFACYFPHQEVLFMFIFPMKAWVLVTIMVILDFMGAMGLIGGGAIATAFEVHLIGAVFGFLYTHLGWSFQWLHLESITEWPDQLRQRSRRAKLKIHDPDKKIRAEAEEADRILAKIHDQGESSLTNSERRLLERYSRRQREKREL